MRSFAAAVGLFSVLPVRGLDDVDRGHARGAMLAFPWLGALLGAIAGAVGGVAAWQQLPLLGPVLALATLAALTGALPVRVVPVGGNGPAGGLVIRPR